MPISTSARDGIAWPVALAAAALLGTLATACMMPFVAIAVASAATMTRPKAALTIGGIWAINQLLGFGLLGYPLTAFAIAWGVALGVASLCVMLLAARSVAGRHRFGPELLVAFMVAFIAYEVSLFCFALLAGGTQTFTAPVIFQILANDGVWFAGLIALHAVLTRAAPRLFGTALSLRPL